MKARNQGEHKVSANDPDQLRLSMVNKKEMHLKRFKKEIQMKTIQSLNTNNSEAYVQKLENLLDILFDAHYGTAYHHCGDGDGLTNHAAAQIIATVKAIRSKAALQEKTQ